MDLLVIIIAFAGAVASVLGLGAAVYVGFIRDRGGKLEIRVISRQNYSPESFGGRAKLQVGDRLLDEASVINAKFVNNSSRVLLAEHFELPVTISATDANLVDSHVILKEPHNLVIDLIPSAKDNGKYQFTRGIFKRGDFLTFQLIADKTGAVLEVDGLTPVEISLVEEVIGELTLNFLGLQIPMRAITPLFGGLASSILAVISLALISEFFFMR